MATEFVAYIDEAGDEGFGKLSTGQRGGQSEFLILGACLVPREIDRTLPALRDAILAKFPERKSRELHFRNLNHAQKVVTSQEIGKSAVAACLTVSHKVTIPDSKWEATFKQKGYLYNYLLRWLLERTTEHCARTIKNARLKVVFSRRSGTNYQSMIDYLCLMRDGGEKMPPVRSINWNVLDVGDIAVENHSKWAGLQIADCITSAFFPGFEPNVYGNYETAYAQYLKGNLISRWGNRLGFGLTIVPSPNKAALNGNQLGFFLSFK